MKLDRGALAVSLIYVVLFAAAFFAAIDLAPDEFLLEEGGYASNLTAPFSVLLTAFLSVFGFELFDSDVWAYLIWFPSAGLNTIFIYMIARRVLDMLRSPSASPAAVSQS